MATKKQSSQASPTAADTLLADAVTSLDKLAAPWGPDAVGTAKKSQRLQARKDGRIGQTFSTGDKLKDKAAVDTLAGELDGLQNLFYADRRYKLLVILQGTDTSGKDGTLRGVFSRMSPLGVHTVGWKAPTENERAHDFLCAFINRCRVPGR